MKRSASGTLDQWTLTNKKMKLMADPLLKYFYQDDDTYSVVDDLWKRIQHFHTMLQFKAQWDDSSFLVCTLKTEDGKLLDTRSYSINVNKTSGTFGTWLKHIQYIKDFKFVRGIYKVPTNATMIYRSRADESKTISFHSYHTGKDLLEYSEGDYDATDEVMKSLFVCSD